MRWEVLEAKACFQEYTEEWDRLNKELYDSHPMLDSRFVLSLLHFFASENLKLAVFYNEDSIVNLLLIEQKNYLHWKTFQPSQIQIGCYLISHEMALPSLLKKLGVLTLVLDLYCLDEEFSFELSNLNHKQYMHANTMSIKTHLHFDDFWGEKSRKLRLNIRRYLKRTAENFEKIEFRVIDDKQELLQSLICYGEIESKGWKGKIGTAIHDSNTQGSFYKSIIENYAKKKQIKIYELLLDDVVVASRIAILNSEMVLMLKTTYLEQFKKYAPGRVLLYKVLEYVFENEPQKSIEFYTDATKEQLEWSTNNRKINHVQIYKNSIVKALIEMLKKIKRN